MFIERKGKTMMRGPDVGHNPKKTMLMLSTTNNKKYC
jgi:hypothetical protein